MPSIEKHHLKVFISYASEDKPVVRRLSRRLSSEGWIDAWVDENKLLPGQDWRAKIEEAVETSDIVILCLSSNSVTKEGFVQKELRYAREIALEKPEETIFLIPLRLDNCTVPRGLRFYQWGDYFGEQADDTYDSLIQSLRLRYEQKLINENKLAQIEKEKQEHEAAEKAERAKAQLELVEKVRLEKAEHEAAENAAREKAKQEAAEKAESERLEKIARDKAKREAAKIAALRMSLSKSLTKPKINLPRAKPFFRITSTFGVVIILSLAGIWLLPFLLRSTLLTITPTFTQNPPTATLRLSNTPTMTHRPTITPAPTRVKPTFTSLPTPTLNLPLFFQVSGSYPAGGYMENGWDTFPIKPVAGTYYILLSNNSSDIHCGLNWRVYRKSQIGPGLPGENLNGQPLAFGDPNKLESFSISQPGDYVVIPSRYWPGYGVGECPILNYEIKIWGP